MSGLAMGDENNIEELLSAIDESKADMFRRFLRTEGHERPLGEIVLADLPEPYFREVVDHHNRQVQAISEIIPKNSRELRWRVQKLAIPTFEDFQAVLGNRDGKRFLPAHLRRANFSKYRRWLKEQHPQQWTAFLQTRLPYAIPEADRARHLYMVGQSGSGKTEFLKLLCASSKERTDGKPGVSANRSLLVVDPGNLAWQVGHFRMFAEDFEAHPEDPNLIYISPILADGLSPVLNPFDTSSRPYSDEEIETLAQQLAGALTTLTKEEKGLSVTMRAFLIPCLVVLLRRPSSTFFDLLRFMNPGESADLAEIGKQMPNEVTRLFFRRQFSSQGYGRTRVSLATKIQSLLNSLVFTRMVAGEKSTLDLEAALNSGKSVVVSVPKAAGGEEVSEAIGRFFVSMTLGIALNRGRKAEGFRRPIDVVLDESQNFLGKDVKTIGTEGRQFGVHIAAAQQVVGQEMSGELEDIILGNTEVKIIGKSGSKNRRIMAQGMEVTPEHLSGLDTGVFVVRSGSGPAVRLKIDTRYLGTRRQMRPEQWEALRAFMLRRYYRPDGADAHQEQPAITATRETEKNRPSEPPPKQPDRPRPSGAARRPKYALNDVLGEEGT